MAENATVIMNNTQQDLAMQVGNNRYFVHFANLAKGAKKSVRVDYSGTYQEFLLGADKAGNKLIVISDEYCDYQCITITEKNGKFDVGRVPRRHYHASHGSADFSDDAVAPASKERSSRSKLRFWRS